MIVSVTTTPTFKKRAALALICGLSAVASAAFVSPTASALPQDGQSRPTLNAGDRYYTGQFPPIGTTVENWAAVWSGGVIRWSQNTVKNFDGSTVRQTTCIRGVCEDTTSD
jgi:hypothetical protein